MKKFLAVIILALPLFLVGCGQKEFELKDYMSEITNVYYQAEGDGVNASVSVGQREVDYKVNGVHGSVCDFTLIEVKFDEVKNQDAMEIEVVIDGVSQPFMLEFNPLTDVFVGDLGYAVESGASISLVIEGQRLDMVNITDELISSSEALEIARLALIDEIASCYSGGVFCGECYLKLLHERGSSFNQLFWSFSLVCVQGVKYDVVINAQTGEVVGENL
mgnify:FL=1